MTDDLETLTREALASAYQKEVGNLFAVYVTGVAVDDDDAGQRFMAGLFAVSEAYSRAQQGAREMFKGDAV